MKKYAIILLLNFFFIKIIIKYIIPFISYIKFKFDFIKIENYLLHCKNQLKIIKKYKKLYNPEISIISPVYNSEKYLLRFINSIENQNFFNIEILMVDDCSTDKSVEKIEKYKIIDNRIILIKNKKNKGTFINRNIGVLFSRGKYIIIPDPDDILSKDIISLCYIYAEKYNYDIIRFNIYVGNGKAHIGNIFLKLKEKPFHQPELSTYIFYGINELKIIDCCVCNKFFKKEVYIKALNSLKKYYLNLHISYSEDSLMNYIIYRFAKSFYFLKKIGYYYIKVSSSITNNLFSKTEFRMKCGFIFLKIIYEYSKNIKYEKDMPNLLFNDFIKNNGIEKITLKNNSFLQYNYYYDIIKNYLNSKYITNENKFILNIINTSLKK